MNRREVIRALSGGIAGIPAVKSIERLSPEVDDVIVVVYPEHLKQEELKRVQEMLSKVFKDNKVVVFEGGPEIKIIKE